MVSRGVEGDQRSLRSYSGAGNFYKCELICILPITIIPILLVSQLRLERSVHVPEVTQKANGRARTQTLPGSS